MPNACIRLDIDQDGVSGTLISRRFQKMSSAARVRFIDGVLGNPSAGLSLKERRQIILIGARTPAEFEAVGRRIQVSRVGERSGGTVEIIVVGPLSDAEHVRVSLHRRPGIRTTAPSPVDAAPTMLLSVRAKGSKAEPLTREEAILLLKGDKYVEILPNA